MERENVWQHIHTERAALADALTGLADADWEHDTLCPGWTVQDIAAHVISNPQFRFRDVSGMFARNFGRSYNTMIFREVRRLGQQETPASVLADFETFAGSTRKVPITTIIEPLLDVLVHTQDILRPLGLHHDMPPDAAALAADRARLFGATMGWGAARTLRLVATDTDWVRGKGPAVEGPMQELLILCTGRAPDTTLLTGDGRELISRG